MGRCSVCVGSVFTSGTTTCDTLIALGKVVMVIAITVGTYFMLTLIGFVSTWAGVTDGTYACNILFAHPGMCPLQGFFVIGMLFIALIVCAAVVGGLGSLVYYVVVKPIIECRRKWDESASWDVEKGEKKVLIAHASAIGSVN